MKDKEIKSEFQKPISDYEVGESSQVDSVEMHPVLKQLLEKSIKQQEQGLVYTHEEAMQIIKDKYPFLK